ncbi:MAG: glycosyltransferase [Clostridia bacterium]|nr:glycosyltransferase [Clostridia bacterium]
MNKKLKVLEVQDCFYPNVDGPIEVMNGIARTFEKNGYGEVDILVPEYPENVEVEGLKIYRCKSLPTRGGYRAAMPWFDGRVKKLIKRGGYDIIHLHSPFLLPRYALKIGKKLNIPVVFTVHTKFRDEAYNLVKSKGLRNFVMNYILTTIDGSDGITSVCKGMIDTLQDYGSKRGDDIKVIYNATAMPRGMADPERVEEIRKKHSLDGKVTFMFAGRLVEAKNVQFSLKALGEVKRRGFDNFKFLIIGDGVYGKTLEQLAQSEGIAENVEFVGRISDKKLIAEYFAAGDLLLFPSVFDNASIVLLESAANGLPCATAAGSCSAERVENGVNGFAWELSESVWADEIAEILKNPSTLKAVSEGAKDNFYLGWDEVTKEYYEYYQTVIQNKK